MPRDCYFELDRAGKEGNLAMAFTVAEQVFAEGKDLTHFVEGLVEHFRHLITLKVMGKEAPIVCSKQERERYEASAKLYSQEQCLNNLEFLIEAQNQIRFMPSSRIALESILLRVMRSHQRLPIEFLVRRLSELEQVIQSPALPSALPPPQPSPVQPAPPPVQAPAPIPTPPEVEVERKIEVKQEPVLVTEDPTPTPEELGEKPAEVKEPIPVELGAHPTPEAIRATAVQSSRHDTLLHFAAVTLEGTIQKTMPNQRR
jgi:DNA polymerase III subunit gamma/tau